MLLTVIVFVLILSTLVFVHELGHFTVARLIGVKVEEFGFGLPPRILGKTVKGTIYSLNWLPIGGFVKLAGEDDDDQSDPDFKKNIQNKEYFFARSKKERSLILSAGVIMNFLVALVLTAVLLVSGVREPSGRVRIEKVGDATPASQVGLATGDIISTITVKVGTQVSPIVIRVPDDLISTVRDYAGTVVVLDVLRGNENLKLSVTPRQNPPPGEGPMGIAVTDLEEKKYPISEAPYQSLRINTERIYLMFTGIGTTLYKLVTLQSLSNDVAGPIGIAQVTGEAVKFGWKAVLDFMSILSLNLAVLNILPIPALDGGRLLFIFAEKILGRRVKPAFEKQTHQIGMIFLLILVLLVSINDIMRLTRGG